HQFLPGNQSDLKDYSLGREPENFAGATPGKGKPGAAVAVVVDDRAAIAHFCSLDANAGTAKRTDADTFGEQLRFVDLEDAAAFGDNARGGGRIDRAIVAQIVRAAEDAIV